MHTLLCQVVMADTSYSDISSKDRPTDDRGVAACEVLICGPVLQVHGALQDGERIDYVTVTGQEQFQPSTEIFDRASQSFKPLEHFESDLNIGLPTRDGFFVKSATTDHRYSLCKVSGFRYEYTYVDAMQLPALLL